MKYSVIVPCYNEEAVIRATQERLSAVMDGLDEDYEIIYVNDGSRDATEAILREIIAADPELVGRLTVAGVVLMLIWLVIDGLKKTARRVRANMGLDEEDAEDAAGEAAPEEIGEDSPEVPEEDEGGTN